MSDITLTVVKGSINDKRLTQSCLSIVLNQYYRDLQLYCGHRVLHCAAGTRFDVFHQLGKSSIHRSVLYEPGKHTDDISNASLAAIPRPLSIVPTDLIRATDTNIFRLVSKAYRGRWRKVPSVLYQQLLNEKMICEQATPLQNTTHKKRLKYKVRLDRPEEEGWLWSIEL